MPRANVGVPFSFWTKSISSYNFVRNTNILQLHVSFQNTGIVNKIFLFIQDSLLLES